MSVLLTICLCSFALNFAVVATETSDLSETGKISDEQYEDLISAGVSEKEITAMEKQIEINNLTPEQIENYITSKIAVTEQLEIDGYEPKQYPKTEDGAIITPFGVIPQMRQRTDFSLGDEILSSESRAVSTVSDEVDSSDMTGVYYLVESTAGYDQITSYLTLPSVKNVADNDRPYHMFGMSSTNGSLIMWGDIGLVYLPSIGGWKGFYNVYETGDVEPSGKYDFDFPGGSAIYFHLTITTSSAILDIIELLAWSVISTVKYDFRTNCVPSDFSTVKLSKQITLAQHNSGTLDISTGTVMTNGTFSETHLYLTDEYDYDFSSSYCSKAVRKGPTKKACQTISYTKTAWTSDTVSISFN